MIDKHNFKAAEAGMEQLNLEGGLTPTDAYAWLVYHKKAIQTAIRFADRCASGEVSEKSYMAYISEYESQKYNQDQPRPKSFKEMHENAVKAMATQMLKEIEDER